MKVRQVGKETKQFSAKIIPKKQMNAISGGKSKAIIEEDVLGI